MLTIRQTQLVKRMVNGMSLAQAAQDLGISYNTARNHIKFARAKLGGASQKELVEWFKKQESPVDKALFGLKEGVK